LVYIYIDVCVYGIKGEENPKKKIYTTLAKPILFTGPLEIAVWESSTRDG
jgi:hypothetical protein